jgi:hypothetical protein
MTSNTGTAAPRQRGRKMFDEKYFEDKLKLIKYYAKSIGNEAVFDFEIASINVLKQISRDARKEQNLIDVDIVGETFDAFSGENIRPNRCDVIIDLMAAGERIK